MIPFNPNGNFLFSEEEFKTAKCKDRLPMRCLVCGETFYQLKSLIQQQLKSKPSTNRFCSLKCMGINNRVTKVVCKCDQCGKKIEKLPSRLSESGKVFCSKSCNTIYYNLHKHTGSSRSKLEVFLEQELPKIFPDLEIQYNDRELCNGLELDLYIPSLHIAFELNGPVHYHPFYGKTIEEREQKYSDIHRKDIEKQRMCNEKRIDLYIIDVRQYKYATIKHHLNCLHYVVECIKENM